MPGPLATALLGLALAAPSVSVEVLAGDPDASSPAEREQLHGLLALRLLDEGMPVAPPGAPADRRLELRVFADRFDLRVDGRDARRLARADPAAALALCHVALLALADPPPGGPRRPPARGLALDLRGADGSAAADALRLALVSHLLTRGFTLVAEPDPELPTLCVGDGAAQRTVAYGPPGRRCGAALAFPRRRDPEGDLAARDRLVGAAIAMAEQSGGAEAPASAGPRRSPARGGALAGPDAPAGARADAPAHRDPSVPVRDGARGDGEPPSPARDGARVDRGAPPPTADAGSGEASPPATDASLAGEASPRSTDASLAGVASPRATDAAQAGEASPRTTDAALVGEASPRTTDAALVGEAPPATDASLADEARQAFGPPTPPAPGPTPAPIARLGLELRAAVGVALRAGYFERADLVADPVVRLGLRLGRAPGLAAQLGGALIPAAEGRSHRALDGFVGAGLAWSRRLAPRWELELGALLGAHVHAYRPPGGDPTRAALPWGELAIAAAWRTRRGLGVHAGVHPAASLASGWLHYVGESPGEARRFQRSGWSVSVTLGISHGWRLR